MTAPSPPARGRIPPIEANEAEVVVAMANPDDRFYRGGRACPPPRVVWSPSPRSCRQIARLRTDPRTPNHGEIDDVEASEVDIDACAV
jgi:hypothetical protein